MPPRDIPSPVTRTHSGNELDSPGLRPALRVLDANLNRGREALRVIEDCLRFVLEDGLLAQTAKQLRHDFTQLDRKVPTAARQAARDTLADVGTTAHTAQEYHRNSTQEVLVAGFKRLQESLRSLEEFSKVAVPSLSPGWEQLRYRAYTLDRAVGLTSSSRQRLASVQLYALIDGHSDLPAFGDRANRLAKAGVDAIQLRAKSLDDRELMERAHCLRKITRQYNVLMIVNDRPDVATLVQADGVHVGQEDLSVDEVRMIVGTSVLVGVSTHSIEQARQAVWDGANYLGVGPTFPSTTKVFHEFPGCELLRAVAREITLPAFAIGGITLQNLQDVLDAGFHRVAVGQALQRDQAPHAAADEWFQQLRASDREAEN